MPTRVSPPLVATAKAAPDAQVALRDFRRKQGEEEAEGRVQARLYRNPPLEWRAMGAPPKLTAFALDRAHRLANIECAPVEERTVALGNLEAARDRFLLELAWDGHRVQACRASDGVRLVSADRR